LPLDRGIRPFQVRTEERDGHLMLAMSGDLALETAAVVIAALDRAGDAVHPDIVQDLRALSLVGRGTLRALVTPEALAGLRGGGPIARGSDPAPRRPRRRRLSARCRSPRGWTTPGVVGR
jgi:hypothetical protein